MSSDEYLSLFDLSVSVKFFNSGMSLLILLNKAILISSTYFETPDVFS